MRAGPVLLAPIGHAWLRATLAPNTLQPFTESYTISGARRIEVHGPRTTYYYPRDYATGDDLLANLRFALRYEPLDLAIYSLLSKPCPPKPSRTGYASNRPELSPVVHGSSTNT